MYTWIRLSLAVLALIVVSACGDDSPTNPTPSGSTVSIVSGSSTLTTTAYNPNPITITRGTTVTWTNNDNTAHTSTSDNNVWNSGNIAPGGSFSMTFQNPRTFPYRCTLHPNMIGTLNVQ
jgi:plastocyanin